MVLSVKAQPGSQLSQTSDIFFEYLIPNQHTDGVHGGMLSDSSTMVKAGPTLILTFEGTAQVESLQVEIDPKAAGPKEMA